MTTKKIASKGYTLEVHSYDRDDENHKMSCLTFDTKDEFLLVRHMCETIFISGYNNVQSLGNRPTDMSDHDNSVIINKTPSIIINYLIDNPGLLELNSIAIPSKEEAKSNKEVFESLFSLVMKYHNKLIGFSNTSYYRAMHSSTGYYSDKDVYLDII